MMLTLLAADSSPWLAVFGRAHPVLLHGPLGLLPALVLLEYGAWLLRRPVPRGAILALAWLTACNAVLATLAGLVLAGEGGYDSGLTGNHKIAAFVFTGLCVLVALLAFRQARGLLRLALGLALVAMVPTGHLGGSLTHGEDFLTAPLAARSVDPTEFGREIAPILRRSCTRCHNPDKKKGELDLTSRAGIEAGGENGAVLQAGKPDDSELLRLCLLPEDDDAVMPPSGKKPRPTVAELERLRAWIAAGAKFD